MEQLEHQAGGAMTVARPVAMLVAGALAAAAAWHVLMLEPARPGALEAMRQELSTGNRQALDDLAGHEATPPPRP